MSERVGSRVVYRTKADAAYAQLRALIIGGRLLPSEPLNQEQLAVALGVSTTPLREALRRLESEGLVVTAAHRDVKVAPLDLEHIAHLFETRAALEVFAISLATARATDSDVEFMKAALRRSKRSVARDGDADEAWTANRALHEAISRGSHNPVLIELLTALWDRYQRCRPLFDSLILDPEVEREHAPIVDAIEQRRPAVAAARLKKHLQTGNDLLAAELASRER